MNKTAIKNFAVWAREKLIADIKYKAGMIGISENGIAEPLPQSTNDLKFFDIGTKNYAEVSGKEIKQREALVNAIHTKERSFKNYKEAFENVVEEVAYTWFNRLIAIRFMEVNEYLPSGVRMLSSENSAKLEPDMVTSPFDTDMEFTPYEQDRIIQLKDENKLDELFRMLFIKQCNKLNEILPELFEKTDDFSELLLTISFTDKDGIVYKLTHDIEEADFDVRDEDNTTGQVEIIGWLFQYYISVPKDLLINARSKYRNDNIPFVTQLFTSDWIVKYIVDNSLGKYWIERNPDSKLAEKLDFFVMPKDGKIHYIDEKVYPADLTFFDPCMGSGHILVYAFDVLMEIYRECGYSDREAAHSILQNNLFGLDIDNRAYQLTYFALMMKSRQYDRRFFSRTIFPQVYVPKKIPNGSILGSLMTVDNLEMMPEKPSEFTLFNLDWKDDLNDWNYKKLLFQKYTVICTNPPYMNNSYMPNILKQFVEEKYKDYKSDLFSAFMARCLQLCKEDGYVGMLTPFVWMFISSYEKLRTHILSSSIISTLVQLEYNSFEGACVPVCSFVLKKTTRCEQGEYIKLSNFKGADIQATKTLEAINNFNCGYIYETNQLNFFKIPSSPIAYWVSEKFVESFSRESIGAYGDTSKGIITGDNSQFLRRWFEVTSNSINFRAQSYLDSEKTEYKWYPCNKGGEYRKWYGNKEYIIDWWHNGYEIMQRGCIKVRNCQDYKNENKFIPSITWTSLSSSNPSFRYSDNALSESAGMTLFIDEKYLLYGIAYLNSKVALFTLNVLNPTLNFTAGSIATLPLIISENKKDEIECLSRSGICISKQDWDSFETSWDFVKHPLIRLKSESESEMRIYTSTGVEYHAGTLEQAYINWNSECDERFNTLKANEEELNRIFIDIYGLQDELTPEVEDKDVTVRKADLERDIKSFISYAVGCMFGRYSLDVDGLAYAGGEWDNSKYSSFIPDTDNCIPITDEEYFEDDIVGRFVEFVRVVYGKETLEENLDFIAKALGTKGNTSREIIRNYFLNGFIKEHIKTYQKRPIYWLFDSGKQNGFKALVYMHRWNANTIGNMRVEYLHRTQRVYEKEMERMQEVIDNSRDNKEINAATKRKEKLQKQYKETKDYDAKVGHLALSRIDIDLDDGVKVNYDKVQTANDGTKHQILVKI